MRGRGLQGRCNGGVTKACPNSHFCRCHNKSVGLNCFAVFGISNAFADELLQLLHILLPSDDYLPRSHYEARVKLKLSYDTIHACHNGSRRGEGDPIHWTGVKRLSTLYQLPYWQVLNDLTGSSNYF